VRLGDKFTALMILIPNRTKVCLARSYLFLIRHLASYLAQWPTYVVCTVYLSSISRVRILIFCFENITCVLNF
jgi:hypothetical protein